MASQIIRADLISPEIAMSSSAVKRADLANGDRKQRVALITGITGQVRQEVSLLFVKFTKKKDNVWIREQLIETEIIQFKNNLQ